MNVSLRSEVHKEPNIQGTKYPEEGGGRATLSTLGEAGQTKTRE